MMGVWKDGVMVRVTEVREVTYDHYGTLPKMSSSIQAAVTRRKKNLGHNFIVYC